MPIIVQNIPPLPNQFTAPGTLQQTMNWALAYIQYSPLTASVAYEPAISIGTMVRNTILNAPFTWPWNRTEFALTGATALAVGIQDYTLSVTDFAYLEKVSLLSPSSGYGFELKDVYNTNILGIAASSDEAQPNAAAVKYYSPGTSLALRFLPVPGEAYTGSLTYQKLAIPFSSFAITSCLTASGGNTVYNGTFFTSYFTAGSYAQVAGFTTNAVNNGMFLIVSVTATTLTLANPIGVAETAACTVINESWAPIPTSFMDIYNNLFLAEAFALVDDQREQTYRQRGMAALLAKAEGLNIMQVNAFLAQYLDRGISQQLSAQLRTQQATQARAI